MSTLLLIAASPAPASGSRSSALLGALAERLRHLGLAPDTLSLRDLPAQALLQADAQHEDLRQALQAVARASVVVLATPIYKAAYSGLLKVFLDLLPQDGLAGKTVWALATGGTASHLLALDYALMPVLAALGARVQIHPVYAADAHIVRDADGAYRLGDELVGRLGRGAAQLAERLPVRRELLESPA